MKSLGVGLFILFAINLANSSPNSEVEIKGMTAKQLRDLEEKAMQECSVKLNINKKIVEDFLKPDTKVPNTEEFKKLMTCFRETLGYSSGNETNWEKSRLSQGILYQDNPEEQKIGLKIWDDCFASLPESLDTSEKDYHMANCTKEATQKAGIEW